MYWVWRGVAQTAAKGAPRRRRALHSSRIAVLGLKWVEHGGAGDTGVFSDLVHRDLRFEALLDRQFHGGGVDPLARGGKKGPRDGRPIAAGGRLSPRGLLRLGAGPGARVQPLLPFPPFAAHEICSGGSDVKRLGATGLAASCISSIDLSIEETRMSAVSGRLPNAVLTGRMADGQRHDRQGSGGDGRPQGIGEAVARRFADEGMRLALTDLTDDVFPWPTTSRGVTRHQGRSVPYRCERPGGL